MRDPLLPVVLVFAAFALANLWSPLRALLLRSAAVALGAVLIALLPAAVAVEASFTLCWIALIACAATAITARPLHVVAGSLLTVLAAAATGTLAATTVHPLVPIVATPVLALAALRRFRGAGIFKIGARVVAGWLIAIALLSAVIPLVTTPGYQKDHMG